MCGCIYMKYSHLQTWQQHPSRDRGHLTMGFLFFFSESLYVLSTFCLHNSLSLMLQLWAISLQCSVSHPTVWPCHNTEGAHLQTVMFNTCLQSYCQTVCHRVVFRGSLAGDEPRTPSKPRAAVTGLTRLCGDRTQEDVEVGQTYQVMAEVNRWRWV